MSPSDLLLGLNAAIYSSLVAALVFRHRAPVGANLDSVALFRLLESSLRRKFPDLPAGFTWREGISKAQSLQLSLDWGAIDAAVERYEAFRYGGAAREPAPAEMLKLVRSLR